MQQLPPFEASPHALGPRCWMLLGIQHTPAISPHCRSAAAARSTRTRLLWPCALIHWPPHTPQHTSPPPPHQRTSTAATMHQPTTWSESELAAGRMALPSPQDVSRYTLDFSDFNPTPGTGRTGFIPVAPNNYPFYSASEVYKPVLQSDGGQLSEWQPMYAPSKEQAEADRAAAYAAGVPHGYVAPGDKFRDGPEPIELRVVSDLHDASEYGSSVAADGSHSGGPFTIKVSPKMRVEELRNVIRDVGGILPALQRLSYAGKHLDDAQRTLEQYGVAYWHTKFPHWPLKIRRH